ncbi:hypothetical protein [Acidocella sp.]|uniref:hypothetical protein n=1 Tax=Acidocella sp. TaxID=50710 RepID=UPI00260F3A81|nr:hypothetical protein [Acidocella sp.]
MKIAVIYVAEPYQCYHGATVASALAEEPGCEVVEYYAFADTPAHLARIRSAMGKPALPIRALAKPWPARLLHRVKLHDQERTLILRHNVSELNGYDAVLATENTAGILKAAGLTRPRLILLKHGAGDRYVKDQALMRNFDLVLLPGPKMERYYLERHLLGGCRKIIGYPKFDIFSAVKRKAHPAAKPFALYNPHCRGDLSSYWACLKPLVAGFKAQTAYDLLVAPHIKLFHRDFGARRYRLRRLQGGNVAVDTGSPAMLDMTYTATASLYIGDISSQVYEYLISPRPCVFLNPRRLRWRDDPHFIHWTLGEVVERSEDIMPAVARAAERHALYRPAQEAMVRKAFGTDDLPLFGAARRAAAAIFAHLGCPPPSSLS